MDDVPPLTDRLAAHERGVARDLELLGLPPANWPATATGPDGAPLLDVLVAGAGMYGVAAAGALLLKGIRNLLVLDAAAEGQEGPWVTYARMQTLRSPKHLPGIALGIPSLTFRAWYEARFGEADWAALYKIRNAEWQDYILWVRRRLGLPVRNGVAVRRLRPQAGFVEAELSTGEVMRARRVVLATGRPGTGGFALPDGIDPALWPDLAAHTGEAIDFGRLAGRSVAVIGAGASAWDNAATALERGAARVEMHVRRSSLPQINKGRGSAHPGFFEGWAALPPAEKWRLLAWLDVVKAPPPHETVLRTLRQPGFHIRFGSRLQQARREGEAVALRFEDGGEERADFLILGTGFTVRLEGMAELAGLAPSIATWGDRYRPPAGEENGGLAAFPWLGEGFELEEKVAGSCPGLSRIHLFNHAAAASIGTIASDIPGASTGAERLAHRMAARFFHEDFAVMRARLEAFDEPELAPTPFFVPRDAG